VGGIADRNYKVIIMKSILQRAESWLLIVPTFIFLLQKMFIGNFSFDVHLHDTYFVLTSINVGYWLIAILILPFICHLILKAINNTNTKWTAQHVVITCISMLVLVGSMYLINGEEGITPRRYYDLGDLQSVKINYGLPIKILIVSAALFLGMQVWIVIYTVFRLIKAKLYS
jgi:heme/copper-type cytochrome/quinol oxidase subunit 1